MLACRQETESLTKNIVIKTYWWQFKGGGGSRPFNFENTILIYELGVMAINNNIVWQVGK